MGPERQQHPATRLATRRVIRRALVLAGGIFLARPAYALDKQGSAHGGDVEGPSSGFAVSGSLAAGVSLYNPTYAARPDNSGRTLLRYAGHLDIDVIGRRLSLPIDVNSFTDRRAMSGARWLVPSEVDLIGGVSTTWKLGPGAIEGAARVEHDHGADAGGYDHRSNAANVQTYSDIRTRYLLAESVGAFDFSGWATLGWFAINDAYYARPDNTGLALFRYAAHVEAAVWEKRLALAFDTTTVTDKRASVVVRPSELDITPEIVVRPPVLEVHLAYERDMPVDRGGLVQQLVYALAVFPFDLAGPDPREADPGEEVHH